MFGISLFDSTDAPDLLKQIQAFDNNKSRILNSPKCGTELWKKARSLIENMLEVDFREKRFYVWQCLEHEIFQKENEFF